MLKKSLFLILVLVIMFSFEGCSRKKTLMNQDGVGWSSCSGPLGDFDVWVMKYPNYQSLYDVIVIPASVTYPGAMVSIFAMNGQLAYKEMVPQTVLYNDVEMRAGTLTESELYTYEQLVIIPYQPGISFPDQNAEYAVGCEIPLPGQGYY